ncbi:pentapeptide repeat-containing protein, partial [Rhodoblastus sp.]|uniref:pentapeptide repeat-containing protein n=1 Tax=Rhodoblastus sp. TaxID=1962975 RepID=UPI0035B1FFB6
MNQKKHPIRAMALAGAAALCLGASQRPAWPQGMLSGVDLTSSAFTKADLSRADVEAMIKQGGGALDLSDKSLNGLDLSNLNLSGANLRGARLNRAKLAGADLHGAQLDQVWALTADFTGANLAGASLFGTQMQGAKMDRANFSHARLAGDFTGASM